MGQAVSSYPFVASFKALAIIVLTKAFTLTREPVAAVSFPASIVNAVFIAIGKRNRIAASAGSPAASSRLASLASSGLQSTSVSARLLVVDGTNRRTSPSPKYRDIYDIIILAWGAAVFSGHCSSV